MRIDLIQTDNWESLNDHIKQELKLDAGLSVRSFHGLAHAVYEVAFGTSLFLSHKKKAGVVRGNTNAFEPLLPFLYKDSYELKFLEWNQEPKAAQEWAQGLTSEFNYILMAEDHPVTAELFNWQEIDQIANTKKIFSFRVSHFSWLRGNLNVGPYSALICSVDQNFAFVIFGAKFKSPPLMCHRLSWDWESVMQKISQARLNFREDQKVVEAFESHLPESWQPVLKSANRLFDRAVIYSPEVNSEAVTFELQQRANIKMDQPGKNRNLESLSLCSWGGMNLFEKWWEPKPSPEVLRGMLTISTAFIGNQPVTQFLSEITPACRIS